MQQPLRLDAAASLGLALDLVDAGGRMTAPSSVAGSLARRAADVRAARQPDVAAAAITRRSRRRRSAGARRPQPVPCALAQLARRLAGRRARAHRTAIDTHRCRGPHRARLRQPLSDDHRPQGARGVRVPRAADRHRPVRPDTTTARCGRRRATTPAAASRSAASWVAAASPCCRRA